MYIPFGYVIERKNKKGSLHLLLLKQSALREVLRVETYRKFSSQTNRNEVTRN